MTSGRLPRVGVFHPGSQHSLQTAIAFQGSGQLAWHATSLYYDPSRWPYRIERFLPARVAARVNRRFRRRFDPEIDISRVRQFGFDEWLEIAARKLRLFRLADALNISGNRRFERQVIELARREPVDVLWGYNTSALEVFRWAKGRGIRCVLDQTIGHPRSLNRIMVAEHERNPEYFGVPFHPHPDAAIAVQDEEVALADLVVCGSEFCAETLRENGCPPGKIRVVPYGFSDWLFPQEPPHRAPLAGRPVEFLFVGTIEPRKGAAYLLEAFAEIAPAEASLTLIGRLDIPGAVFARFAGRVRHIPHIPRTELVGHYRRADCFVFPSLFEGSALVLYEAVASGLGIVQSRFAGEGVQPGVNGLCLDRVDTPTLLAAIRRVIDEPGLLVAWQEASWRMRGMRSWKNYAVAAREILDR
ncbi:MAG: hypothetical protein RL477_755 [Pseudomonadota bacterium]